MKQKEVSLGTPELYPDGIDGGAEMSSLKYPIPKRIEKRTKTTVVAFKAEELELLEVGEGDVVYILNQRMYDDLIINRGG